MKRRNVRILQFLTFLDNGLMGCTSDMDMAPKSRAGFIINEGPKFTRTQAYGTQRFTSNISALHDIAPPHRQLRFPYLFIERYRRIINRWGNLKCSVILFTSRPDSSACRGGQRRVWERGETSALHIAEGNSHMHSVSVKADVVIKSIQII